MYGRLSDIFGRKPCLLASLVVFFIGALGCSVSQSMIMLIVFRAVEGIGGGGILTLTMIIGMSSTLAASNARSSRDGQRQC